jgi:ABC-type multidrug transport system ATPase subunit
MSNIPAIEVLNLHKSFGETEAVQGVNFQVQQGEIFSLLGPNGAGKTTTISMLSCLLRPDEGDARVMGHPSLDRFPILMYPVVVSYFVEWLSFCHQEYGSGSLAKIRFGWVLYPPSSLARSSSFSSIT